MKKLILIAGLTVALSAPAFAATNLVLDGDFSSPNVGGGWTIAANGTTPWTNLNDSGVEIGANGIYGLPTVGSGQLLEVNGNTWGDVVQTVSGLTIGNKYVVSYLYGGRTSGGPDSLVVSFGGNTLTTNSGSVGVWTANSFVITATAKSEVLEFKSVVTAGNPSFGNEISTVSVSGVPELSTWAMMLSGFAVLGFAGYRRKAANLAA